jgi:hypothetical protein
VYFLHDADSDGGPVRTLVVTHPGWPPGTRSRGVLFTFDSEAT